jgi:hypothetical protein
MDKALDKDPALLQMLAQLRALLGEGAFDIVNHWESDWCAVGVASPRDHGVLVYLSTFNCEPGFYDVELELPPPGEDAIYSVAGKYRNVGFDDVVSTVREHLTRADH